jgi:hypothetical protein
MHAATPATPATATPATLPVEFHELALELALAMHSRAMYPPGHPLLQTAMDRLYSRVQNALAHRGEISLGIAHRQVVIEGVATDDAHPLLRAFALHLHQHQIAAIRIVAGVEPREVEDFLSTVSMPVSRTEQPLGLLGPDVLQQWKHLALFPAVFDKLELIDGEDSDDAAMAQSRAAQLWLGLARAALSAESHSTEDHDPAQVARAINSHTRERAYDDVIVGHLLQMGSEMANSGASPSSKILRERLSAMVRGLRPETLSRLLEMGGDLAQRQRFVMFSVDSLSTGAVLDIFSAASSASGHPVATAMTHLLAKLAQNAGSTKEYALGADHDLRRHVKSLVTDWSITNPNPEEYNQTLTGLSGTMTGEREDLHREEVEPERLLEISLEADALGHDTSIAIKRLISREGLSAVVERIQIAAPSATRQELLDRLLNVSMLQQQLHADRPDLRALKHVVRHLHLGAVEPLLAAMESRGERDSSWLTELIIVLGESAAPHLGMAFPQLTPSSRRVLLAVFEQWNVWPGQVNLRELGMDADPLVRRDAVRLLLKNKATRDEGLLLGLRDSDERVYRQALFATRGATAEATNSMIRRAEDARQPEELRARTIRALAATGRPEARQWLIDHASVPTHGLGSWLSGDRRLRRKSATTLAALVGLAMHWRQAPDAAAVLALAAKSRDPEFRDAVTRHTEGL